MVAKRAANYFVVIHNNSVVVAGSTLKELHGKLKFVIGYNRVYHTFWRNFRDVDRKEFVHNGETYYFQKVL
jgi:hypothetical protein